MGQDSALARIKRGECKALALDETNNFRLYRQKKKPGVLQSDTVE